MLLSLLIVEYLILTRSAFEFYPFCFAVVKGVYFFWTPDFTLFYVVSSRGLH